MKQALRVLFFASAGAALAAGQQQQQTPTPRGFGDLFNQAPPHIDKALRERIGKFYALHQEKKWRQADALVHEESKDIFFNAEKLTFRSYKIAGITYEENFTRAKVVIDIDTDMFFPGFGQMQVNRPLTSVWRLDQNEWWWNVPPFDPAKGKDSPWGTVFREDNPGGGKNGGGQPADPKSPTIGTPTSMEDFRRALAELKNKVVVDKTEVVLPSHEPAEAEVIITNQWDNPVHLTVDVPELPGLSLRLDKSLLPAGEKTKLRVISKPETRAAKPSLSAMLTIEEISKRVDLQIIFLPPPNRDPKPGSRIDPATGRVIEPPPAAALPKKP